jgi:hypothetical protein
MQDTTHIETRALKPVVQNIKVTTLLKSLQPGESKTFITDWPDYLYKVRKRLNLTNRVHVLPVRSNMFVLTRVY